MIDRIGKIIKFVCLLIIVASSCLPLAKCTSESPYFKAPVTAYFFAWRLAWICFSYDGIVLILYGLWLTVAFLWPIPFLVLELRLRKKQPSILLLLFEVLLSAFSTITVFGFTRGLELVYGVYLLYSALGLCLATSLVELAYVFLRKLLSRALY